MRNKLKKFGISALLLAALTMSSAQAADAKTTKNSPQPQSSVITSAVDYVKGQKKPTVKKGQGFIGETLYLSDNGVLAVNVNKYTSEKANKHWMIMDFNNDNSLDVKTESIEGKLEGQTAYFDLKQKMDSKQVKDLFDYASKNKKLSKKFEMQENVGQLPIATRSSDKYKLKTINVKTPEAKDINVTVSSTNGDYSIILNEVPKNGTKFHVEGNCTDARYKTSIHKDIGKNSLEARIPKTCRTDGSVEAWAYVTDKEGNVIGKKEIKQQVEKVEPATLADIVIEQTKKENGYKIQFMVPENVKANAKSYIIEGKCTTPTTPLKAIGVIDKAELDNRNGRFIKHIFDVNNNCFPTKVAGFKVYLNDGEGKVIANGEGSGDFSLPPPPITEKKAMPWNVEVGVTTSPVFGGAIPGISASYTKNNVTYGLGYSTGHKNGSETRTLDATISEGSFAGVYTTTINANIDTKTDLIKGFVLIDDFLGVKKLKVGPTAGFISQDLTASSVTIKESYNPSSGSMIPPETTIHPVGNINAKSVGYTVGAMGRYQFENGVTISAEVGYAQTNLGSLTEMQTNEKIDGIKNKGFVGGLFIGKSF